MLRFYALWDDTDSLNREIRTVIIQYFLVDDTVAVIEVHKPNSGRDPFPVLMCRQKLPKKIKPESGEQHDRDKHNKTWWHFQNEPLLSFFPETFPSCVLEISKEEVDEYYSPKDFHLGQTVRLHGRLFLPYNCDAFTKEYYQKNYPEMEMNPIEVPEKTVRLPERKKVRN